LRWCGPHVRPRNRVPVITTLEQLVAGANVDEVAYVGERGRASEASNRRSQPSVTAIPAGCCFHNRALPKSGALINQESVALIWMECHFKIRRNTAELEIKVRISSVDGLEKGTIRPIPSVRGPSRWIERIKVHLLAFVYASTTGPLP